MTQVRKVVDAAARRLWFIELLRALCVSAALVLGALIVARVVQQIFSFEFPWPVILWSALGVTLLSGAVWSWAVRGKPLTAARVLDERAGLRESLSTAMCVWDSQDPWARAVVESAETRARGLSVREAVPIEAPRAWPAPLAAAIVFGLVWQFLPSFDVLKVKAERVAKEERVRAVVEARTDIEEQRRELAEALAQAKLDHLLDDLNKDGDNDPRRADELDPDALRREEMRRLTTLTEKLEQEKAGEKAQQLESLKEAMRQIKQNSDGPLNEFTRAMSRGDFQKAQQQLQEMKAQMESGSMSPEEKAKAQQQMSGLAEQLKKLANAEEEVAKQLEKAGLDSKTAKDLARAAASNPQDLQKALEQAQNLTPEQKEKLAKMAQAAAQACENAGNMSQAMAQMAQGMGEDGMSGEGMDAMSDLGNQLSEAEMLSEDMQNVDAALARVRKQLSATAQCLGGQCDGEGDGDSFAMGQWREGDDRSPGAGSGGPGLGMGAASPQAEAADFMIQKEKANVQTQGGPIIGSRQVFGEQIRGQSTAEFAEVVETGMREAAEAMETMQIPREFHDPIKHYFGTVQAKVQKQTPGAAAPVTPPPAAPPATPPAGTNK
jgi:tetratricopeptide (TPR) repeat protein